MKSTANADPIRKNITSDTVKLAIGGVLDGSSESIGRTLSSPSRRENMRFIFATGGCVMFGEKVCCGGAGDADGANWLGN